jgi:hypothetical protein
VTFIITDDANLYLGWSKSWDDAVSLCFQDCTEMEDEAIGVTMRTSVRPREVLYKYRIDVNGEHECTYFIRQLT